MKKKKLTAMLLILSLGLSLAACGSSHYDSAATEAAMDAMDAGAVNAGESFASKSADYKSYEGAVEEDYEMDDAAAEEAGSGNNTEIVATNRKLIKRVNLTAETREFEKLTHHIEKKVESLGGYMESADVFSGNTYSSSSVRHASYTARVPVARMNELVDDVGENANITNKSESAEDVTLSYVDNKSRKEALEVEMDRLMEILKQAEDVDTIVALEQRITEVRYEIQNIESTLRTYDNLVDFATVNITVNEVEVYTPEPVKKVSDWERMTEGFMHSLKSVGRGILNFFIGLVIALPYLLVWGIVILVIVLIVRHIIKGGDKRREKRAAKKAAKEAEKAAGRAPGYPGMQPAGPQFPGQQSQNPRPMNPQGQNLQAQNPQPAGKPQTAEKPQEAVKQQDAGKPQNEEEKDAKAPSVDDQLKKLSGEKKK